MAAQPDAPTRTSSSAPDIYQPGPIAFFDHHLKVLGHSYINFFQDRVRIEEIYVESLHKLVNKVKVIDEGLDDRGDHAQSTVRRAWREVRDSAEREATSRRAFIDSLMTDVVSPLVSLKDTQERSRKRIKEDLNTSLNAYNDYAENTLPRLRRTYLRKCQEVEDYKSAMPPPAVAPPSMGLSSPLVETKDGANPSRPVVTSPAPLRPLDRRPSGHQPQPRARSPSTSTAFQDLAHQGKKQLNQLMTFLDRDRDRDGKGGTTKEGISGRTDNALRSVRAKREADEADKEYRKGVHWLETLRLHRAKILEGAYTSLEAFVHDNAVTVKAVVERYADSLIATFHTNAQLATHARSLSERMSAEKDTAVMTANVPKYITLATPNQSHYYNFHVGECLDLIFGVSLVDYATGHSINDEPPRIVQLCIAEVDQRGLDSEGIYRISGRHAIVQELTHKIERDERAFRFNHTTDDVYAVSSLLKLYLRELPEPLFRFPLEDRVKHTEDRDEQTASNFPTLRSRIRRLPPVHQATLKAVVEHLARVCARSATNKMDAKNLSIVFGTPIFGEDELPKNGDLLSVQSWKDTVMEDLITHANTLFDPNGVAPDPPLPPAPQHEPAPAVTYGSAHTQISNLPPAAEPQSEDFTPQLPPRPEKSIHPSRRANTSLDLERSTVPSLPPRPTARAETTPAALPPNSEPHAPSSTEEAAAAAEASGPVSPVSAASFSTAPESKGSNRG